MAVFLVNSCKFGGCDHVYDTLSELIQHIEESHIADPVALEKHEEDGKLAAIPLSLALQYFGGGVPRKSLLSVKRARPRTSSVMSSSASIRSLTPTSSECDYNEEDDLIESFGGGLDSDMEQNGAITAEQQFASQLILRMMSNKSEDAQRPYICPIQGCKKRYKNINGVKYHARNGHKREAKLATLTSKCFCGKSFRTAQLLQKHSENEHALSSFPLVTSSLSSSATPTSTNNKTTVKLEPIEAKLAPISGSTSVLATGTKGAVSVIHPLTLSGNVILTSGASARQLSQSFSNSTCKIVTSSSASLVTSASGELLLTHKLSAGSMGTGTAPIMTPPTTPHKAGSGTSRSQQATLEQEQQQRIINEKVARALAEAKAMSAMSAGNRGSGNTTTQIVHLVNSTHRTTGTTRTEIQTVGGRVGQLITAPITLNQKPRLSTTGLATPSN